VIGPLFSTAFSSHPYSFPDYFSNNKTIIRYETSFFLYLKYIDFFGMKALINKVITPLVMNNFTWKFLQPFAKAGTHINFLRSHSLAIKNFSEKVNVDSIFQKSIVLHGPFSGLKYPALKSAGSTVYPKLLGCYEQEVQTFIENACNMPYSEIIDIGCAEGYYAIGLAMRINTATVLAYDINDNAKQLCHEMAMINGVQERVVIESECTAEMLENFEFTKRGLIICDCEGFELQIFNEKNVSNLKKCDLLIETHDFIDIEISGKLRDLFSKSHRVTMIKSIDDIEKAQTYNIPEIQHLSLNLKRQLVGEYRPAIMEWLICESIES
jgi:hypothetical protein